MASRYLDTSGSALGLSFLGEHKITAGRLARMGIRARRALLLVSGKARPSSEEEANIRARFERGPRAA